MSEPTPRPWDLGDEIELRPNGIRIYAWQGPIRVSPADAAGISDAYLIVRAVNAHDELVEALMALMIERGALEGNPDTDSPAEKMARAALQKAKGNGA